MSTRLQLVTSRDGSAYPLNAPSSELQPASYTDWLASLTRGDMVYVKQSGGELMPPAMVTNYSPCFVFVGKLKFHRRDGWQVGKQSKSVYRMKLRLVRNEKEFMP